MKLLSFDKLMRRENDKYKEHFHCNFAMIIAQPYKNVCFSFSVLKRLFYVYCYLLYAACIILLLHVSNFHFIYLVVYVFNVNCVRNLLSFRST